MQQMEILRQVWSWAEAHPGVLAAVGLGSVLLLLIGVIALPLIVVRLPADHFVRPPREERGLGRLVARVLRNGFGVVVLLAGVLMLFLPGQGLLTILAGLLLLDFPGKRRLLLRLLRRPDVRRWIDGARARAGKPPLELPSAHRG